MTETEAALPPFMGHLAHHAATQGDATAIHFQGRDITWADLEDRARRNAAGQRAADLPRGGRVGYYGKNHPACFECIYGSGYAGTVCAVVNWRLSPEEIHYALEDADVELLFVSAEFAQVAEGLRDRLPKLRQTVVVDGEGEGAYEAWLAAQAPMADEHPPAPDDGWFQLYTSGTTGFPKGAVLTHGGIRAHSEAITVPMGFRPESVSMVAMPLYHVGGVCYALAGLWMGCRSVLVEAPMPVALLEGIAAHRVTHAFFVPAIFGFFQQVPDLRERDLSSLETLCYGASPMPLPLLKATLRDFPHVAFWQVYGMTEMSGVVTMLDPESHRNPAVAHRLVSAGKPLDTLEIRVVEPATVEDCAPRELGEVLVRSDQRLREYYGRPEATAQAFTADGWYRSGDAGYFDEDGYLYISDRIKDMIISGGENVYPAEIERVLVEHPAVREVAVIGVPSDKWGETVKAVVALADPSVSDEALIEHCRAHLAHYKCPTSVDRVEALPRNATGKVLKRDLRAPYWEGHDRQVV
jgi:acyl-CoA synthetase (AMP-forming)/AMP-acid ligase II